MELLEQAFVVFVSIIFLGFLAFIIKRFDLLPECLAFIVSSCVFGVAILLYQIFDSHNDVQKIIDDYPYVLCEEIERPEFYQQCKKVVY